MNREASDGVAACAHIGESPEERSPAPVISPSSQVRSVFVAGTA